MPRRGITSARALVLAGAIAGCATSSTGIVRVWINRTETAIEVQEAIIGACSKATFTEAQIDAAAELRRTDRFPVAPPGTVDLTTQSYTPESDTPLPLFIVELPDGKEQYAFGSLDESTLPACAGRAAVKPDP